MHARKGFYDLYFQACNWWKLMLNCKEILWCCSRYEINSSQYKTEMVVITVTLLVYNSKYIVMLISCNPFMFY